MVEEIELPEPELSEPKDKKKAAALDHLEEFFNGEFVEVLLPEGSEISRNTVSLKGIPSAKKMDLDGGKKEATENVLGQMAVNLYIPLYFSSFLDEKEAGPSILKYEMEYLLSGKNTDRENLKEAIKRILALRGALNLLFLLSSPERKAEADALAAATTAGIVPAQLALSFFILTMWAFGEAVLDVRTLLAGGNIELWKTEGSWQTSLTGLLDRSFLNEKTKHGGNGRTYTEYLSSLLFLMNREERNFRMIDLIQWNIRMEQADFSAENCAYQIELETDVIQRHMFFQKEEYRGKVNVAGSY